MNNIPSMLVKIWFVFPLGLICIGMMFMAKKIQKGKRLSGEQMHTIRQNHTDENMLDKNNETVNPYGSYAVQQGEETVNPYGSYAVQQGEETVNPYGSYAVQQGEETVNPYSWSAMHQGDETVNPYDFMHAPVTNGMETGNPFGTAVHAAYDEEEETVNPYAMDWMPKIAVGLLLEENERKWNKQLTFSGSVWVGSDAKCEMRLQNLDSSGYCAELTYGGGNLYVRNLSRGGEVICLDGERLGDDLVPLKKGSVITMSQMRITMESLTNMSLQR